MEELRITVNERLRENVRFREFLDALPETFGQTGETVHDRRNVLKQFDARQLGLDHVEAIVVKRYHGLFFFQRFYYSHFRKPKCRRAYDYTAELRRRGFDAAEHLACVEVWNGGWFKYGFFVSAKGRGERLDNYVIALQEQGDKATADDCVSSYASLVYGLHLKGVLYCDMNCGNVLCSRETGGSWHFCLIDTNRAQFYDEDKLLPLEKCITDLILMNERMGTVRLFIGEYLRQRGCYSESEVDRIVDIQHNRHKTRRRLKDSLKRYKKKYYEWLGR